MVCRAPSLGLAERWDLLSWKSCMQPVCGQTYDDSLDLVKCGASDGLTHVSCAQCICKSNARARLALTSMAELVSLPLTHTLAFVIGITFPITSMPMAQSLAKIEMEAPDWERLGTHTQ